MDYTWNRSYCDNVAFVFMAILIKKVFFAIILILTIGFFILSFQSSSEFVTLYDRESTAFIKQPEKITLIAVGDIMLDRGVEYMVKKHGQNDFYFPFSKLNLEADIVFGNLESVISTQGKKVGSIYSFRAEKQAVLGLKKAGFNVLSLANNHALDYQRIALEDTMISLKENGIDYIGAGFSAEDAFSVKIKEVKGVKIGFLAYTNLGSSLWRARLNGGTGLAWIDRSNFDDLKENIKETKNKVDILVVSLHAGVEYSNLPNSFQKDFAKICLSNGADLILGHHPHVKQPLEKINNGWVAYSLGNFVFDQNFSEETMKGMLLRVTIENKKITQVKKQEIIINSFFQPEIREF